MIGEPSLATALIGALLSVLVLSVFYGVRSPEERQFLLPLALISFIVKAIAVPIYYTVLVREGLDGFAFHDAYEYHLDGIELMYEFENGVDYSSRAWKMTDPAYSMFTGIVYWIFGPNTLLVRVLNCMFSTLTLLYVYRICRIMIDEERAARWACYLVAFLPYSIVILINQRKEPLVTMLAMFIFYHAIRVIRFEKNWPFAIFFALCGLLAMNYFRSGFVLPFLAILFLCYFLTTQSVIRGLVLAVPTLMIVVGLQVLVSGDASFSLEATTGRFQGKALDSASLSEAGGMVRFARMSSPLEVYKLPLATFLVAILPFPPIVVGSLPSVILYWLNLLNLAFFPAMLQGILLIFTGGQWRRQLPLFLFPFIFLMLIGAVHVGVIRYRETVFPAMLILAALGMTRGVRPVIYFSTYMGLLLLGGIVFFARAG